MSEAYEAVLFVADGQPLFSLDDLSSELSLRLVRVDDRICGIYRVAPRPDRFDHPSVEALASEVSARAGSALAAFYDNQVGLRSAVLYSGGERLREFGTADEWWCPMADDGTPVEGAAPCRLADIPPDEEYECRVSAIDAALKAIGAGYVPRGRLVDAFCYGRAEVLETR